MSATAKASTKMGQIKAFINPPQFNNRWAEEQALCHEIFAGIRKELNNLVLPQLLHAPEKEPF